MKRRSFIQMSLATLGATTAIAGAAEQKARDLYELRAYSLSAKKQDILDGYLSQAFLPALKRYNIGPVGVFVENMDEDKRKFYVLIVHSPARQEIAALSARLSMDEEYRKAAKEYLDANARDPVYTRIESSLLAAIEGMPRLAKPDTGKTRLMNLRIYESHNERAAQKKIEMFNKSELAIFRRVGLTPVLFSETLIGAAMPNLTYMLVFPDDAERKSAWARFVKDDEWLKLRAIPEYADKEIVSHITNKILTPASYSEI